MGDTTITASRADQLLDRLGDTIYALVLDDDDSMGARLAELMTVQQQLIEWRRSGLQGNPLPWLAEWIATQDIADQVGKALPAGSPSNPGSVQAERQSFVQVLAQSGLGLPARADEQSTVPAAMPDNSPQPGGAAEELTAMPPMPDNLPAAKADGATLEAEVNRLITDLERQMRGQADAKARAEVQEWCDAAIGKLGQIPPDYDGLAALRQRLSELEEKLTDWLEQGAAQEQQAQAEQQRNADLLTRAQTAIDDDRYDDARALLEKISPAQTSSPAVQDLLDRAIRQREPAEKLISAQHLLVQQSPNYDLAASLLDEVITDVGASAAQRNRALALRQEVSAEVVYGEAIRLQQSGDFMAAEKRLLDIIAKGQSRRHSDAETRLAEIKHLLNQTQHWDYLISKSQAERSASLPNLKKLADALMQMQSLDRNLYPPLEQEWLAARSLFLLACRDHLDALLAQEVPSYTAAPEQLAKYYKSMEEANLLVEQLETLQIPLDQRVAQGAKGRFLRARAMRGFTLNEVRPAYEDLQAAAALDPLPPELESMFAIIRRKFVALLAAESQQLLTAAEQQAQAGPVEPQQFALIRERLKTITDEYFALAEASATQ